MDKSIFQRLRALLLLVVFTSAGGTLRAEPVDVKHPEGTAHGFLVLRSADQQTLATGELTQTPHARLVTSELVLRFTDQSRYEETTVFSQDKTFRLISDRVRAQGPSFSKPSDSEIDARAGNVRVSSLQRGKENAAADQRHLDLPSDLANGLLVTLLKNLAPAEGEKTLSLVTTSAKPRVVKLKIRFAGAENFRYSASTLKANHYVVHTEIGGVSGAMAALLGKQPPDIHVWITSGKAPTFVRFSGPLYAEGPIWNIELASLRPAAE